MANGSENLATRYLFRPFLLVSGNHHKFLHFEMPNGTDKTIYNARKCTFCDILFQNCFGDPEPPSLVWSSGSRCAADVRTIFQKSSPPYRQCLDPPLQLATKKRSAGGEAERSSKTDQRGNRKSNNSIKTGKPADIFAFRALLEPSNKMLK